MLPVDMDVRRNGDGGAPRARGVGGHSPGPVSARAAHWLTHLPYRVACTLTTRAGLRTPTSTATRSTRIT